MDLQEVNRELEEMVAEERLNWAAEKMGKIVHGSSFRPEDMAIIHLTGGNLPTFFLDTNYHFEETLELVETARKTYELNLDVHRSYPSREAFEADHGPLYETDPDECCRINKIEPLQEALEGVDAWVAGLRREQSPTRADTDIVEKDGDRLKVSPLADWSKDDLWSYIEDNDIPYNPLHDQGYPSVGCEPCTSPVGDDEDERSGRWSGSGKTECGLHDE